LPQARYAQRASEIFEQSNFKYLKKAKIQQSLRAWLELRLQVFYFDTALSIFFKMSIN